MTMTTLGGGGLSSHTCPRRARERQLRRTTLSPFAMSSWLHGLWVCSVDLSISDLGLCWKKKRPQLISSTKPVSNGEIFQISDKLFQNSFSLLSFMLRSSSYLKNHSWNLERWYWWTNLQGSNGDADIENRLVDTVEEKEGETNGESGIETYTLPHVK